MDVFWLEQIEEDVPAAHNWLSPGERLRMAVMRFPKRRTEWRLGRWTAKCAVAAMSGDDRHQASMLADIEICSLPSGAPYVLRRGKAMDVSISLSHRAGRALCSVAPQQIALGCDLEVIEPRGTAFVDDYFTHEEQRWIDNSRSNARDFFITLFWSAKESALKALHAGLTLDTRSVVVELCGDSSLIADHLMDRSAGELRVRCKSGRLFQGWFQASGNLVRTFLTATDKAVLVALGAPDRREAATQAGRACQPI